MPVPNILVYALTAVPNRSPDADLRAFGKFLSGCPFSGSVERALWGGFHADRLSQSFVAGYGAALRRAFEHVGVPKPSWFDKAEAEGRLVSFAATEVGGAHPRAIAVHLDKRGGDLLLTGEKTFATLAPVADDLLVVASRGVGNDGTNRLRVVRILSSAHGVRMETRTPTPFAPELPHARVHFTQVSVNDGDVLPGDGYSAWLKPFRTHEDVHVLASTVGYLLGASQTYRWERTIAVELTSVALSLIDLGARDPSSALTHVLLAGVFEHARRLFDSLGDSWRTADLAEAERWERDRPLLSVADGVRQRRLTGALTELGASPRD